MRRHCKRYWQAILFSRSAPTWVCNKPPLRAHLRDFLVGGAARPHIPIAADRGRLLLRFRGICISRGLLRRRQRQRKPERRPLPTNTLYANLPVMALDNRPANKQTQAQPDSRSALYLNPRHLIKAIPNVG